MMIRWSKKCPSGAAASHNQAPSYTSSASCGLLRTELGVQIELKGGVTKRHAVRVGVIGFPRMQSQPHSFPPRACGCDVS